MLERASVVVESPGERRPILSRIFRLPSPAKPGEDQRRQGVLRVVEDLVTIVGTFFEAPEVSGDGGEPKTFGQAIQNLEERVYLKTGRRVHLATIVPAGIVGVGVVQVAMFGLMLETLPGIVLVWFGIDAYLKLNPQLVYGPKMEQSVVDIIGLPDVERQIVTRLLREGSASVEEVARHVKLDEFAARAHLNGLIDDGYVEQFEESGEIRYRPTRTRKRGSSLGAGIWDKIDAKGGSPPDPTAGESRRRGSSELADRL
jgi:DNA-binding transcriptional ArsR family regulator